MTENTTGIWDHGNMFTSRFRKILHDPECENQCCSMNLENPLQSSNYNDVEQLLNDVESLECNSVDSNTTSTTSENQFLCYDMNTSYDAQVPEYREVISHSGMVYSDSASQLPMKDYPLEVKRNHCKGITKRKRKRTIFTTEQIIAMEGVFKKRPYVCREERLFLTKKLNISEKSIKVWFQNRRRVTEKREKDRCDSCHSDSTIEEMYDAHKARLDYIESQINENTDEYGFVTLNNKAISDLVKVIDTVLSHRVECGNTLDQSNTVSQNENYLMYEPISPESLSEEATDEDILKWTPSKPEESLQRLIDIQTVFYM